MGYLDQKQLYLKHLYFLAAFASIIVIELFYREPLFNYSDYFISQFVPTYLMTPVLTAILHSFSIFGAGAAYFVVCLLAMNWYSRGRTVYYFIFLSSMLTIQNAMKIGYHEARPFMAFANSSAIGCSHEYGNPSGHSLFSAGFAIFLFLDFFGGAQKNGRYWGFLVAANLYWLIMGFARIYQGVHTINQVFYGW